MNNNAFPVCVHCMTFSQSKFIVETMNGVATQQTSFPYICCILDDASTDGEQEIIQEYLKEHFELGDTTTVRQVDTEDYQMLFARHRTNRNCYFAVYYLKYNHYRIKKSKKPYLDSWNKQVKYLANCEEDDYWSDARKLQMQYDIPQRQNLLSLAKDNKVQTLTMFYRNITPVIPDELKGKTVYAQFYAMRLAEKGDIYYINEPLAV